MARLIEINIEHDGISWNAVKLARHAGKSRQWAYNALKAVLRNEADMDYILENRKMRRIVRTKRKKRCLVYKFRIDGGYVEYTVPEIAEIAGISLHSARDRLKRAMSGKIGLKKLIGPRSEDHVRTKRTNRPRRVLEKPISLRQKRMRLLERFDKGDIKNLNEYLRLASSLD